MSETLEKLLCEALQLTLVDRAALIDELLSSLQQPDERVDALWTQEAEERLKAYRAGELKAIATTRSTGRFSA